MNGTTYRSDTDLDDLERVRSHYGPESRWAVVAGQRLQALRRMNAPSVLDFLNRTGLSKSSLSRIENGIQIPAFGEMVAIAHLLGVEVDQIWPFPTWPDVLMSAQPDMAVAA